MANSESKTRGAEDRSNHKRSVLSFIGWCAVVVIAMAIGQYATFSSLQSWYPALNKPSFNPPNAIFGPVWGVLYLMMAISVWNVWEARANENCRESAIRFVVAFLIQLALNVLWSVVFFGLRSPHFAFIEICCLWLAIAVTIWLAFRVSKLSAWLLVPYLCWVSFAAVLNYQIWQLN